MTREETYQKWQKEKGYDKTNNWVTRVRYTLWK